MLQSPIAVVHSGQPDYQPLRQPTAVTATTAAIGYPSHHFVKFNRRKAIGIGTALIVAAAVGMILNVVDIVYEDERYGNTGLVGQGFWAGAVVSKTMNFFIRLAGRAAPPPPPKILPRRRRRKMLVGAPPPPPIFCSARRRSVAVMCTFRFRVLRPLQ
jgi:hypothetical protein